MGKWMSRISALIAGMVLAAARLDAADADTNAAGMAWDGSQTNVPAHLQTDTHLKLAPDQDSIWAGGIGDGFRRGAQELSFGAGAGLGIRVLGSTQAHDLALGTLGLGWMLTDVVGKDHWYRGNVELLVEAFGGAQFHPKTAWVAGAAPLLRYNFATGSRWVPFVDLGAGGSATDIGHPDLSTTFEFNLQGGFGTHYFFCRDAALTFQYRYLHLSNAGISQPNYGVNANMFYFGASWFF